MRLLVSLDTQLDTTFVDLTLRVDHVYEALSGPAEDGGKRHLQGLFVGGEHEAHVGG
ncbi:MAG: hypothetical protein GW880_17410, partial [Armatimonadetes bacterium]|nr:hypothetical protein [Armatimonadota bacterium]